MIEGLEGLSFEENLRAETEILKLKLESESGAVIHSSNELKLPAEVEFEWYNHIYNYEKLCKEAGTAKVFDFIGQPQYKKIEELNSDEIENELNSLIGMMYSKGVALSYDEECYSPYIIYKFITEELFEEEVNCYLGPGGHRVFDYEEFHPNHDKDLRRYSFDYFESLSCLKKWFPEYLHFTHEKTVILNGKTMSLIDYSDHVTKFQFINTKELVWEIVDVKFDLETSTASVKGNICLSETDAPKPFSLKFNYSYDLWIISEIEISFLD